MFGENNQDESFGDKNKFAQYPAAPNLQRSVSAPAIAEHVSDAMLPPFKFGEEEGIMNSAYPYGANGGRRGNAKQDENEFNALFIDDPNHKSILNDDGIMASLRGNEGGRHPLNMIQADFPSTPSAMFSNRIIGQDSQFGDNNASGNSAGLSPMAGSSTQMPPLISNAAMADESLDQTAKSFQKLYVGSESGNQFPLHSTNNSFFAAPPGSPNKASVANASATSGAAGTINIVGTSAHANFPSPTKKGASSDSSLTFIATGAAGSASTDHGASTFNTAAPAFGSSNDSTFGFSQATNATTSTGYSGVLGSKVSAPAATSAYQIQAPAGAGGFGAAALPQMPQLVQQNQQMNATQQAGNQYYTIQQPTVYVNQHGQAIYYRPGTAVNQYGQEYIYASVGADGSLQMAQPVMDPNQMQQFPPYAPQNMNNMQGGYYANDPYANNRGAAGEEPVRIMFNNNVSFGNMANSGGQSANRQMNPQMGGGMPMGQYGVQAPMGMNMQGMNQMGRPMGMDQMYGGRDDHHGYDRHDRRDDYGRGMDRDRFRDRDRPFDKFGKNNNLANLPTGPRDPLVEEFRNTFGKTGRQWNLRDLVGHIVPFCQDQHGSRFIQQKLEICGEDEKQLVFDEILPTASNLMTDVFGNYVLQKLFEYGNPPQCESLAVLLTGQAVQLSMQMYGCRVVQKALEYVNEERLVQLVREFEEPQMLIRCVHDSNGNHVIQKCIEIVSKCARDATTPEHAEYMSSRIQFIIDEFKGKVKELSSHPYGCRVVQRILEHCTSHQKGAVLEELRDCCGELVQDCYGNYVIQFVMQHGWEQDRAVLIKHVQANLLEYSQHKFASNVVEKCLQYASKKDRDEMIWTIINVTFDLNNPVDAKGHCVLESMVRDPYANYVVQKVIDVSDDRQRGAIMRYVKDNINQLRKYTYGKHIIVRLEKITNEKF